MTTDHLRAFTEDPWLMARIAAVHALGDIWAMGARPQAALAQVILPRMSPALQARTLAEIMDAAARVFAEAGADVVGGHTSLGAELTIGFTVTGLCRARHRSGRRAGRAMADPDQADRHRRDSGGRDGRARPRRDGGRGACARCRRPQGRLGVLAPGGPCDDGCDGLWSGRAFVGDFRRLGPWGRGWTGAAAVDGGSRGTGGSGAGIKPGPGQSGGLRGADGGRLTGRARRCCLIRKPVAGCLRRCRKAPWPEDVVSGGWLRGQCGCVI